MDTRSRRDCALSKPRHWATLCGLVWAAVSLAGCPDETGEDVGADTGVAADLSGGAYTPPAALSALVDVSALHDRSTLLLEIQAERSGRVPGDFSEPVWQIGLEFTSQNFAGETWRHSAVLVVPETLPAGVRTAGIVQRETLGPVAGLSDSDNFLPQFAAITADRLDMPILLLSDVPPVVDLRTDTGLSEFSSQFPECFASTIREEATFRDCMINISQAAGRPELFPVLPVAVTYVRATTLLQELAERAPTLDLGFTLPAFAVDEVAVFAEGLSGYALRHAMALDGRIAGVFAASADIGNLPGFYALEADVWSDGFSYVGPETQLPFYNSAAGAEFLQAYGLFALNTAIATRTYLMAVGTNDPSYPLESFGVYASALPTDHATLYIAGYGAGKGTMDHLLAWRVFLAHVFGERAWADIEVANTISGSDVTVSATITGGTLVQAVTLHYVDRHQQTDDTDLRDAAWASVEMVEGEVGTYQATFSNTVDNGAFFVRVLDSRDIYEGPLTSEILRVP